MHKYMRAIGFSQFTDHKKLKELLKDVIMNSDERSYTINENEIMLGEFVKKYSKKIGIAVCGEFDEDDKFTYEYYFPFLVGDGITTTEDISVERHAAKESYAGICDDVKVGISLIFYLRNMIPYVKAKFCEELPIKGTTLTLSALSISASVMMPIMKNKRQVEKSSRDIETRNQLIEAARKGDEDAMESLTLEDMDMYTTISKKIQKEDIFSIVDTYFMPYGVECDQYSVLGEILACEIVKNEVTLEDVYLLKIISNELIFDVAINKIDLFGEPAVGRRFKGIIWLQGFINYPNIS